MYAVYNILFCLLATADYIFDGAAVISTSVPLISIQLFAVILFITFLS